MSYLPKACDWFYKEGIFMGGDYVPMHEPLYFLNSRGGAGTNEEAIYHFRRTRPYFEFLKDFGYNHVWFNWWKGYGMDHERECQKEAVDMFATCTELGLRSICYFSLGSLTPDTLLLEEPGAEDWFTLTQEGRRASCQTTHQPFRVRPCYTSEEYMQYMEKALEDCLNQGADGIHFDNIGMQAEPEACHCPRCQKLFREYLVEKYTEDQAMDLFGYRDLSQASIPWFNQHNSANKMFTAKVPLHRAWIDFKCKVYSDFANRLIQKIRSVKADAFIEMNGMESDGFATGFWRANDYDNYMSELDMVFDEGNTQDYVDSNGLIRGSFRAKKWCCAYGAAHRAGKSPRNAALDFAEDVGNFTAPKGFMNKYKALQMESRSDVKIAVLRERNSLLYNRVEPWYSTLVLEQYFIENRIPFDFITNPQIKNKASDYSVIVISGAEIISDDLRDELFDYVREGGSVFFADQVGIYDENYLLRRKDVQSVVTMEEYAEARKSHNAFAEVLGDDPYAGKEDVLCETLGKGKIGWLKKLDVPAFKKTVDAWMIPVNDILVPENSDQIKSVLDYLMPEGCGIKVETDQKVYVHTSKRVEQRELFVHLINYSYPDEAASVKVVLDIDGAPEKVVSIAVDDQDTDFAEREEVFTFEDGKLTIDVAGIKHHRSLIITVSL